MCPGLTDPGHQSVFSLENGLRKIPAVSLPVRVYWLPGSFTELILLVARFAMILIILTLLGTSSFPWQYTLHPDLLALLIPVL